MFFDAQAAAAEVARTTGRLHLLLNVTGVLHTPEGLFPGATWQATDSRQGPASRSH